MNIFDTHCHLDMEQFDADRCEVFNRSNASGVTEWLIPSTSVQSTRRLIHAPWRNSNIRIAAGIHPHEVTSVTISAISEIESFLLEFPEICAIGEFGLDFFYDIDYVKRQIQFFEAQLELSERYHKPMIIHCRNSKEKSGRYSNAYKEALDILEGSKAAGVLHSFTGSIDDAMRAIELGWYISLNGIVTFKQSNELREVAKQLPSNRILIETDAPYLAPVPMRGKRNEPSFMIHTLNKLADIRNESADSFGLLITQNAHALFGLT